MPFRSSSKGDKQVGVSVGKADNHREEYADIWEIDVLGLFLLERRLRRIDYALANSPLAPYLQMIELLSGGPNSKNARLSDHLGLLITLTTLP